SGVRMLIPAGRPPAVIPGVRAEVQRGQPVAVVLVAEQCREGGGGGETGQAQPLDAAVEAHKSSRLHVAEQRVIPDEPGHPCLLARPAGTVPGRRPGRVSGVRDTGFAARASEYRAGPGQDSNSSVTGLAPAWQGSVLAYIPIKSIGYIKQIGK